MSLKFKLPLFIFFLCFHAQSTELSCNLFSSILKARERLDIQPFVPVVDFKGLKIPVGIALGKLSSDVFLSKSKDIVIKFYEPYIGELALLEFWTAKYYEEMGVRVPKVPRRPFLVKNSAGKSRVVVLKEYIEGLTSEEFKDPIVRQRVGLSDEKYANDILELKNKVQALHANGRFWNWLEAQGLDMEQFSSLETIIHEGDFKLSNLLLTPQGFVMIDP